MQIQRTTTGDLLELKLSGLLDNESSRHFQSSIDEAVRDGWHRILVDLSELTYLSSAGISVLLAAQKQLGRLKGFFGVANPTPEVTRILAGIRLLDRLVCNPEQVRGTRMMGTRTLSMNVRLAAEDGLDLQIYTIDARNSLACEVIGTPEPLRDSLFTADQCRSLTFTADSFGIGLGALGEDFTSTRSRFGEFLSVMGAVAQSGQQLPDYALPMEEYVPTVQLLYGVQVTGSFSHLLRFSPTRADDRTKLSQLIFQSLQQAGCQSAGLVLLAESAGLVGARLRSSPAEALAVSGSRFDFPAVRDWLSFSSERVYSRNLALVAGIARLRESEQTSPALDALLRPVDQAGKLLGHFHAAVFPYQPLKKRTLELAPTVQELFGSGAILDVLHLLRDDRNALGVGESELLSGACWVAPLLEIS